jgi:hypothetical protein
MMGKGGVDKKGADERMSGRGKKWVDGTWGKSRRGVEGTSDVRETAAVKSEAVRAVVLGFETEAATSNATVTAAKVSGSERGEWTRDEQGALADAARDAE